MAFSRVRKRDWMFDESCWMESENTPVMPQTKCRYLQFSVCPIPAVFAVEVGQPLLYWAALRWTSAPLIKWLCISPHVGYLQARSKGNATLTLLRTLIICMIFCSQRQRHMTSKQRRQLMHINTWLLSLCCKTEFVWILDISTWTPELQ